MFSCCEPISDVSGGNFFSAGDAVLGPDRILGGCGVYLCYLAIGKICISNLLLTWMHVGSYATRLHTSS